MIKFFRFSRPPKDSSWKVEGSITQGSAASGYKTDEPVVLTMTRRNAIVTVAAVERFGGQQPEQLIGGTIKLEGNPRPQTKVFLRLEDQDTMILHIDSCEEITKREHPADPP